MQLLKHKLALALVPALITLIAVVVAYGFTPAIDQAVGGNDTLIFRDFQAAENNRSFIFRWSKGDGTTVVPLPDDADPDDGPGISAVALPQTGQPALGIIDLRLWMPDTQVAQPLTLKNHQRSIVTLPVHGRRDVHVLLPRAALNAGDLHLNLISPTWSPPNDPRPLGIGVEQVRWQPLGWTLPPTRQLWTLPLLATALALLLIRLNVRSGFAIISATIVATGLAISAALRPFEVAPYTHRLLLVVILAHIALLLWSALHRSDRSLGQLPQRVGAPALLLLLGIGYWMSLLFQNALALENGSSVSPRIGTQIIGLITLALLSGLALWPRLGDRRWQWALVLLAIGGVAEASYAATFAFRRSGPDFFILWRGAYDFHLGRPLYRMEDVLTNHFGHVFKVPPFYGMFFLPIADASDAVYNLALTFHRSMNIVLYLITGGLLVRLLRPQLGLWVALSGVGIVLGLMQPPFDTIAYGQIDVVLLLLLVIALLALRSQRPWLVGLAITLGTLFKLYPLLIVGFLLVRREWKAVGWVAAWMVILNGLAIAVMGWANHVLYVTQVVPNISGGTSWVENQTINGFVSRLIRDPMITEPIHGRLISLVTYAGFALVAGTSLLLALAPFERRSSAFALQFSVLAVVMVLAVPAAWMHYATITILTFLVLVWYAHDHLLTLGRAGLIALAFGLIAYGNQWSFFDGTRNPGIPALALSSKFYGLAILWVLTTSTIWQAWIMRRRTRVLSRQPRTLVPTTPSTRGV